jgi:hypothetical protein
MSMSKKVTESPLGGATAPFDIEERAQRWLLRRFVECASRPLKHLEGVSRGPGAYGLIYTPKGWSDDIYARLYRPFRGRLLYAGQAAVSTGLNARLVHHRRGIDEATGVEVPDVSYVTLETRTGAFASMAEGVVLDAYRGELPWNVITGFGCRNVGANRSSQVVTKWDAPHPGRYWSEGAAEESVRRVVAALEVARCALRVRPNSHWPDRVRRQQ